MMDFDLLIPRTPAGTAATSALDNILCILSRSEVSSGVRDA